MQIRKYSFILLKYITSWYIECFNVLDLSFLMSLRNKQKGDINLKPYLAVSVNIVYLVTNYPTCLLYTKSDINILYTKERKQMKLYTR